MTTPARKPQKHPKKKSTVHHHAHAKNKSSSHQKKSHTRSASHPHKIARPSSLARSSPKKTSLIHGTLIVIARGGGIVRTDEYKSDIKIPEKALNTALHGDEVAVKITGTYDGEAIGAVTNIVQRAKTNFTGVLYEKNGAYFMKPADNKMYVHIAIPKDKLADAAVGDRVYGAIEDWTDPQKLPEGKIIRSLGKPLEHEAEMQAIALERGFKEEFAEEVLTEAHVIDHKGITPADLVDRRDFRSVPTFTIDPYDAKDFDDAISVQRLENEDIEIGIHIADVSHYVQQKTELDSEALFRGTSVYLVDRTIPMLPRTLSDDLCSLMADVDRLTMSAVITFSPDGVEKSAWFGPSVIHSAQRFTYEEAQAVLDGKNHHLEKEVHDAAHIARILGKARAQAGALILEQEEIKVIIDKKGVPVKIVKKVRTESHTLIEELMLLANRRIAEFLEKGGKTKPEPGAKDDYAVIYRVHESPSEEKTEDLAFFMRSIGFPIPLTKEGSVDPKALQTVLKKLEGNDLKQTVLSFVIRSMSKAIYTTKNVGHYGLQFKHYTHFTSPIRRYPDLIIHRMLRKTLAGKPAPASERKFYERLCRLCNMAELRAADAERESVKFKLTQYMAARIGEEVEGLITGIADWGMYVRDKATTAEGLVGMRTLGNEQWQTNPKLATITGLTSGRVYRIGDTIKVRIVRANPELRQIDYEIVQ